MADERDPAEIWHQAVQYLRTDASVSPRTMALLTLSRLLAIVTDTALVAAPSTSAKELFEHRISDQLIGALSAVTGRELRIAVTVDEALLEEEPEDGDAVNSPPPSPTRGFSPSVDSGVDNTSQSVHSDGSRLRDSSAAMPADGEGASLGSFARTFSPQSPPTGEIVAANEPSDETRFSSLASASEAADSSPFTNAVPSLPQDDDEDVYQGFSAASPTPPPRVPPRVQESTLGEDSRLNAKYTFETFVIGASNRFAQAAASAVAEAPAKAYNPLFIYGGSGLGKTHLLHAVGHYAQRLYPGIVVRYVNSEEFTNDFINSVQSGQFGKAQEFQRRYRDIDILLIDDIQFLQRAPETMEAFFHTFNTLYNTDKQIVITSDLPPKELGGFEDRMRSRFEMGLMTDVQPPDLETRIAILRRKVDQEKAAREKAMLDRPGTDKGSDAGDVPVEVLEYIASHISTNIRELEGALIRVQALHSLSRQPLDVALAESVLKDLLAHDDGAQITATSIIAQTAAYFGLEVEDVIGTGRSRRLVSARQIAMYLCRELTDMPLIRIGEEFGGRDHTTVMHANKKISELMKERRAIFNQVTELTARIKNTSARA